MDANTFVEIANDLEDECARSEAYRDIALSLIDGFADREVEFSRKAREQRIKVNKAMTVGFSGATH